MRPAGTPTYGGGTTPPVILTAEPQPPTPVATPDPYAITYKLKGEFLFDAVEEVVGVDSVDKAAVTRTTALVTAPSDYSTRPVMEGHRL